MKRYIFIAIFPMLPANHLQSASSAATGPENVTAIKLHRQLTETDLSLETNVSLDSELTKDHNKLCLALSEIQSSLADEGQEALVELDELVLDHYFLGQQFEPMGDWITKAVHFINETPLVKNKLLTTKKNGTDRATSSLTAALKTEQPPRRLGKSISAPARNFTHTSRHAKHITPNELPSADVLSTTPPDDSQKFGGLFRWFFKKKVDQAAAKKTGERNAATPADE